MPSTSVVVLSSPMWDEGNHTKQFSPLSYYDGSVNEEGDINGKGAYVWGERTTWMDSPALYCGEFRNGLMSGLGCFIDENGTFIGQSVDDLREGPGIFVYKSGALFVGNFKDDEVDPESGVTYRRSGEVLRGVDVLSDPNDASHTISFTNSDSYFDGELDEDKKLKNGVMVWKGPKYSNWHGSDWNMYNGAFDSDGQMHGSRCVLVGQHGTYIGDFSHGSKHGEGVFLYKDQTIFVGKFDNGEPADGFTIESSGRILQSQD